MTNIQGDVIEIRNAAGATQVTYEYDAWGNILSSSGHYVLELLNPLRYRRYVYDVNTELYYLQSRYYNPKTGRFLNADGYTSTGQGFIGNNMFAYCNNNPVNYADPSGYAAEIITFYLLIKLFEAIEDALTVIYDVPAYRQGDTNLCWAFCQVMIEDYRTNSYKTPAERKARAKELAILRHGEKDADGNEIWNQAGYPTNCAQYDARGNPIGTKIDGIFGLYMALKESGPLYAHYSAPGEEKKKYHLVVVVGVNVLKGIVYTNNPWNGTSSQSYTEFLNGVTGYGGDEYTLMQYILCK